MTMYFFDINEIDEKTYQDLMQLLEYYYSGEIYDDETLQKYVEKVKSEEVDVKKSLPIEIFKRK